MFIIFFSLKEVTTKQPMDIITKKIQALYKVNEEVANIMLNTKKTPYEFFYLSQEQTEAKKNETEKVTHTIFKIEKKTLNMSNDCLLKSKFCADVAPHMFCKDHYTVEGVTKLKTLNSEMLEISKKYISLGSNNVVLGQLEIILKNLENVQVALGNYNERFIVKKQKYEDVSNYVDQVNTLLSKIHVEMTFTNNIPQVIFESSILRWFFENVQTYNGAQGIFDSFIGKKCRSIYNSTTDGFEDENFHKKCDGAKCTLIICKNLDDLIFGGYTSKPWFSSEDCDFDSSSFLFLIWKKGFYAYTKFNIIPREIAVSHSKNCGPVFGMANKPALGIKNRIAWSFPNSYGDNYVGLFETTSSTLSCYEVLEILD